MVKLAVPDSISAGDSVRLCSEDKGVLKLSALGYLTLTLLLFLGGIVGTILKSEWLAFFLSILFVGLGVLILKLINPKGPGIHVEKV